MIDSATPKGRLIQAALRLAAERPWSQITLDDIAQSAMMPLAELRKEAHGKDHILALLIRAIDDDVLAKTPVRPSSQGRRDRLFEVIMSRFDALAPYRSALRSILKDAGPSPIVARAGLRSMRWMLEAAGISTSGPGGPLRVMGLAQVYRSVLSVWVEDDDPGLARTMAALDRRLRRAEQTISSIDGVMMGFKRVGDALRGFGDRAREAGERARAGAASATAAPEASSTPPPSDPGASTAPGAPAADRPSPGFF